MRYRFLEHTADIKFRAYGKTLNEAFENAGLAFFEVITDTSKVKPLIKKSFELKAEDIKSLLYDFLEELLVLHEAGHYLFSRFKVKINRKTHSLKADVWGDVIKDHEIRNAVKAVTYSEMEIIKSPKGVILQVVLDL